jgi:chorismate synthase
MHPEQISEAHVKAVAIHRPRPGHADLAGGLKYGHEDLRNVLERASARETAARTAAGAVAVVLLESFGIRFGAHVVEIGGIRLERQAKFNDVFKTPFQSQVRCVDAKISRKMVARIDEAKGKGDSLGGRFEVRVEGLPPGLGSYVQWDRKIDGRIARALMSIQSVKAVEIGLGVGFPSKMGSQVHDEIHYRRGRYGHDSNNAGGIEGGMTNGEELLARASMKPIPTLMKPLKSVDMATHQAFRAKYERSDVCSVPAAAVVGLCVTAFELADAFCEKFGSDSLREMQASYKNYQGYLKTR